MTRSISSIAALLLAALIVAPQPASAESSEADTVTLITGDQVTLPTSAGGVVFHPAKGRERVPFTQKIDNGKVSVFPFDVQYLIATGALDPALFNVTDLPRTNLPLIVQYASPEAAEHATLQAAKKRTLKSVNSVAASVSTKDATTFWRSVASKGDPQPTRFAGGIEKIQLDGMLKLLDVDSVQQVRAPAAWQRGQTAKGVKVAVLDTGIDADHPDIAGKVLAAADFTSSPDGAADSIGHGTHVASIIAGTGPQPGVAPDANLLIARVCEGSNCAESHVLAGMEWAVQNGAKIVNMSLGGVPTDGTDKISQAVNTLTAQSGVLFVTAAGNLGADQAISAPGSADAALTVGSVTKDSQLSYFSSRGPRIGDFAVKPEISAPGYAVTAARAKGTTMGFPLSDRYTQASGTSMATPHVSAAAAILASQHPDWPPARLKAALISSAEPIEGAGVFEQGTGVVNLDRATGRQVFAEPATLSLVTTPTGTITYRNESGQPVKLNLQVPSGLTVDQREITVPAHGSTPVKVTAAPGDRGAVITARGAQDVVRTAISVHTPRDKKQLVVNAVHRNGAMNGEEGFAFLVVVANHETKQYSTGFIFSGQRMTAAVRQGRYTVFTWIPSLIPGHEPFEPSFTLVAQDVTVTGDSEVTLDSRPAKPVGVKLNGVEATGISSMEYELAGKDQWTLQSTLDTYVGDTTTPGMVYTAAQYIRGVAGSKACGTDSTTVCNLAISRDGGLAVTHPVLTDSDLAKVDAKFNGANGAGARVNFAHRLGSPNGPPGGSTDTEVRLPGTLTSYFHGIGPVGWVSEFFQTEPEFFTIPQSSATTQYLAGKQYREDWLSGVFGPAVTSTPSTRNGDVLRVTVPMLSDSSPGHVGILEGTRGTGRTELYREGTLVTGQLSPDSATFQVPPGRSRYRLFVTGTREATTSSQVSASWEFVSESTRTAADLPLLAVCFAAPQRVSATADLVPFQVDRTSTTGRTRQVTVEASFDDGVTWAKVPVVGSGDRGVVLIQHAAGSGHVSLHAVVKDDRGNTVDQKILRGYLMNTS